MEEDGKLPLILSQIGTFEPSAIDKAAVIAKNKLIQCEDEDHPDGNPEADLILTAVITGSPSVKTFLRANKKRRIIVDDEEDDESAVDPANEVAVFDDVDASDESDIEIIEVEAEDKTGSKDEGSDTVWL